MVGSFLRRFSFPVPSSGTYHLRIKGRIVESVSIMLLHSDLQGSWSNSLFCDRPR